jgi:hypothetical protein
VPIEEEEVTCDKGMNCETSHHVIFHIFFWPSLKVTLLSNGIWLRVGCEISKDVSERPVAKR